MSTSETTAGAPPATSLAERLRAWRKGERLTQKEAAAQVGVSTAAWRSWESGARGKRLAVATREQLERLLLAVRGETDSERTI